MGIVISAALVLANWGYRRWLKGQNQRAAMAFWDEREQSEAADAFVRGLPRDTEGGASSESV